MKQLFSRTAPFWALLLLTFTGLGQSTTVKNSAASLSPQEIIRLFTTKESELLEAWKDYAYQQETKLQVIGPANTISGEFYQLSEFVMNDSGKRIERIIKSPMSTLDRAGLTMTQEDRNAFINLQPFALTATELPNYQVTYKGKEKIDDLSTYVFEVVPKAILDQRELKKLKDQKIEGKYFQGTIWVDDQDLQIVKTAGKIVPEFKQRFPKFETYRENIDGKYWFPTYTYGDDHLVFERGPSVHIRNVVRYKNYRRFSGDVKIREVFDEVVPEDGNENKETKPTGGNAEPTIPAPTSKEPVAPGTPKSTPPVKPKKP